MKYDTWWPPLVSVRPPCWRRGRGESGRRVVRARRGGAQGDPCEEIKGEERKSMEKDIKQMKFSVEGGDVEI